MFNNYNKINKELAHKDNDDDVLICNTRPLIPAWLESSQIKEIQNFKSQESFQFINKFYTLNNHIYVLNSIESVLEFDLIESSKISIPALSLINDFYQLTSTNFLIKALYLPEFFERAIAKITKRENKLPSIQERHKIFNILNNLENFKITPIEYSNFFNDTKNYFFYRKHHEHVPGLMLIETARQAMYSQFYNYDGFNKGEVSISMKKISCNFMQYIESCYPVEILVKDANINHIKYPKSVDKTAQFFQNGLLVAEIRLQGSVMKMPIFNRFREINIAENRWFAIQKNIKKEAILICQDGSQINSEIEFLSINQMQVRIKTKFGDKLPYYKIDKSIIYVDNIGFICIKIDINKTIFNSNDSIIIGFAEVDINTKKSIKKILKEYCYSVGEKSYYRTIIGDNEYIHTNIFKHEI